MNPLSRWFKELTRVALSRVPLSRSRAIWLGIFVCCWPLADLLHELAVLVGAHLMSWAAGLGIARQAAALGMADEVYSRLVLSMLQSATPRGIALQLPIAGGLAAALPGLFATPAALPAGSLVGVVFTPSSSAVGVQMVQLVVNVLFIAVATCLLATGFLLKPGGRAGRLLCSPGSRIALLLCAACAVAFQLRLLWSGATGGEMSLSMVATKLLGLSSGAYDGLMRHGLLLSAAVNVLAIVLAAGAGLGAALIIARLPGLRSFRRRPRVPSGRQARLLSASAVCGAVLLYGPVGPGVAFQKAQVTSPAPEALATIDVPAPPQQHSSVVLVTPPHDGTGWQYWVNGQPDFIRGFGYNAITQDDSAQQRAARFDHDFSMIRADGANTIVGWDEREFDDVLMGEAADHDLGVILPFQMTSQYPYEDPGARAALLQHITDRVEHFKDAPALRMWGLGNEVVHEIGRSHGTVGHVQAFASFLVQAADVIHQLDPTHPVVYRDAEDWYLAPVAKALAADGVARPWFVYGMNFFTTRLEDAVVKGPTTSFPHALMVSEFGPIGLLPDARPGGYEKLWNIIVAHRDRLLGGCAYVWTTAGPEPLDRNFGLTNLDGQPVDRSVFMLASLFQKEQARDESILSGLLG